MSEPITGSFITLLPLSTNTALLHLGLRFWVNDRKGVLPLPMSSLWLSISSPFQEHHPRSGSVAVVESVRRWIQVHGASTWRHQQHSASSDLSPESLESLALNSETPAPAQQCPSQRSEIQLHEAPSPSFHLLIIIYFTDTPLARLITKKRERAQINK